MPHYRGTKKRLGRVNHGIAALIGRGTTMNPRFLRPMAACLTLILVAVGCAPFHPHYGETRYEKDKYLDPQLPSDLATTGIESADIEAATSKAVGSMLASSRFSMSGFAPAVVIAPEYFSYTGPGDFTIESLIDLLRHELLTAADGRVRLVDQPANTIGGPAQYAIGARVTAQQEAAGAIEERYTQIVFEAIDLASNEVVFSERHAFKKGAVAMPKLY